jgi:hypothetical protein
MLFAMSVVWMSQIMAPAPAQPREAEAIAQEAYIFLHPVITMEVSRRQLTNIEMVRVGVSVVSGGFREAQAAPVRAP